MAQRGHPKQSILSTTLGQPLHSWDRKLEAVDQVVGERNNAMVIQLFRFAQE